MAIYEILEKMRGTEINSREKFIKKIETELEKQSFKSTKKILKIIWQQIGERDDNAEICLNDDGKFETDNELKDYERVPYGVDIIEYFKKEVKPYVPDAWIDESIRDKKDGNIGIVGYDIPFSRFFYKHEEPRKVEEIEKDIEETELEVQKLLKELGI